MIEQDKTNKTRLWGHGIGTVAVLVAGAWKFFAR